VAEKHDDGRQRRVEGWSKRREKAEKGNTRSHPEQYKQCHIASKRYMLPTGIDTEDWDYDKSYDNIENVRDTLTYCEA
jgi:hypothetical protein